MRLLILGFLVLFLQLGPVTARSFVCAGQLADAASTGPGPAAAKTVGTTVSGTRAAVVLFARFADDPAAPVPAWAGQLLDPALPGSFAHYWDTMSFGQLRVRGEVAPRQYASSQPASAYLAATAVSLGCFGRFAQEILAQADADLDFTRFDNDGPDGVPDSGDDDGTVDAVLIVVERTPAGFLLGPATGIDQLGLQEVYLTGDTARSGRAVQIHNWQGAIVQGRSLGETAGALCHEYGHLLGLLDLYNTGFLSPAAGPEEDSAGVGAWCLMGWGALGWNGDDGPNSLCAWSRARLGWTAVITPTRQTEQVTLTDVGQGGAAYQVPVGTNESFILEYRRRDGCYYDRHLLAEGVLIWHAAQPSLETAETPPRLDLECADGRWQDAGYPLGTRPDVLHGGDNLDFWAHDAGYAQAHAGNLGDATDPFDGERYTAFTPETNPSSHTSSGQATVRIEGIRIEDGMARFQVQSVGPHLVIQNLRVLDASGDALVATGEETEVRFWLANQGSTQLSDLSAVLSSSDPLVEVLQPTCTFPSLAVGSTNRDQPSNDASFPRLRVVGDFVGAHAATLDLRIYAAGEAVARQTVTVVAGTARQVVEQVAVVDTAGNSDGQAQPGEVVGLSVALGSQHEAILPAIRFELHALTPGVRQVGNPMVSFGVVSEGKAQSRRGPEFVIPADLPAGSKLVFSLSSRSAFGDWADTLEAVTGAGRDQTPPRVTFFRARMVQERQVEVRLSDQWLFDGSAIRTVRALLYDLPDTSLVASFPLRRGDGEYTGTGALPTQGTYLALVEAEDIAANLGRSAAQPVQVGGAPAAAADTVQAGDHRWTRLRLTAEPTTARPTGLAIFPSAPAMIYALSAEGLWRSDDDGQSWRGTGYMGDGIWSQSQVLVDPRDAATVYLSYLYDQQMILRSRDYGRTWAAVPLPPSWKAYLLAIDPLVPGRLYATRVVAEGMPGRALVSDDEGQSWREIELSKRPTAALPHPTIPAVAYLTDCASYVWPARLWQTLDGGQTWSERVLDRVINEICPDPRSAQGLYAVGKSKVWYSADGGLNWRELAAGLKLQLDRVQVHPRVPEVVYASNWSEAHLRLPEVANVRYWSTMAVSRDAGGSWQRVEVPGLIQGLALDPVDPSQGYLLSGVQWGRPELWRWREYGQIQERLSLPLAELPCGAITADARGRLLIAHAQGDTPAVLLQRQVGSPWERRAVTIPGDTGNPPSSYNVARQSLDLLFVDPQWPEVWLAHSVAGETEFMRSGDDGRTWQAMPVDRGYGMSSMPAPQLVPVGDRQPGLYCLPYPFAGPLLWSADFGLTWSGSGLLKRPLAVDPEDDRILYAEGYPGLYASTDGGQQWELISPQRWGETSLALAFQPGHTNVLLSATSQGMYLSTDKGRSWTQQYAAGEIPWTRAQLRFDPTDPGHVLLVESRNLLESKDGGRIWTDIGQELGGTPWFNDLAFDPADVRAFYVTTTAGTYRRAPGAAVTAIAGASPVPWNFTLAPCYPNPFNPATTIRYILDQSGPTELSVYDLLGQRVVTLARGSQEAGPHTVVWDGRDQQGHPVATGIYLLRLASGGQVQLRKALLLR